MNPASPKPAPGLGAYLRCQRAAAAVAAACSAWFFGAYLGGGDTTAPALAACGACLCDSVLRTPRRADHPSDQVIAEFAPDTCATQRRNSISNSHVRGVDSDPHRGSLPSPLTGPTGAALPDEASRDAGPNHGWSI